MALTLLGRISGSHKMGHQSQHLAHTEPATLSLPLDLQRIFFLPCPWLPMTWSPLPSLSLVNASSHCLTEKDPSVFGPVLPSTGCPLSPLILCAISCLRPESPRHAKTSLPGSPKFVRAV